MTEATPELAGVAAVDTVALAVAITPVVADCRLMAAARSLALAEAPAPMAVLLIVNAPDANAVLPTVAPVPCVDDEFKPSP